MHSMTSSTQTPQHLVLVPPPAAPQPSPFWAPRFRHYDAPPAGDAGHRLWLIENHLHVLFERYPVEAVADFWGTSASVPIRIAERLIDDYVVTVDACADECSSDARLARLNDQLGDVLWLMDRAMRGVA